MKNHPETLSKRMHVSPEGNDGALKARKKGLLSAEDNPANGVADAEALVRQSSLLLDLVNDAIIAKAVDGTITSWNAAAERMFGYSAAEIVGRSTNVLFPPDRMKEADEIMVRTSQGESIAAFETIFIRKDGRPLDVSVTISPLKNEVGKIIGSSKILRDLTEFNRVKRQIEEQTALLDKTQDAILISDLEGRILFWNKGAERVYGWARQEAVGRPGGGFF
jgi:PAS domain S-box-containing protein